VRRWRGIVGWGIRGGEFEVFGGGEDLVRGGFRVDLWNWRW
jgi:hypothetical protein